MSTELKRFEMVSHSRGMESWDALEERADGDYVLFTDYEKAAKVRDGVFSEIVKSLTAEKQMALRLYDNKRMERDAHADVSKKRAAEIRHLEDIVRKLASALADAPWRLGYQDERIQQAKAALASAAPYIQ